MTYNLSRLLTILKYSIVFIKEKQKRRIMGKVIYEEVERNVNHETGEVTNEKSTKRVRSEPEPPYFKVYLEEVETILKLPKDSHKLIFEMAKEMKYDGIINVNGYLKEKWMKSLGYTNKQSINNAISKLTQKEALKRIGTGCYQINPHIIAKGSWEEIKLCRGAWIKININSEGKKEIETNFDKQKLKSVSGGN